MLLCLVRQGNDKVFLTLKTVDEILKFDHSNKTTEQYFPIGYMIKYVVQSGTFRYLLSLLMKS